MLVTQLFALCACVRFHVAQAQGQSGYSHVKSRLKGDQEKIWQSRNDTRRAIHDAMYEQRELTANHTLDGRKFLWDLDEKALLKAGEMNNVLTEGTLGSMEQYHIALRDIFLAYNKTVKDVVRAYDKTINQMTEKIDDVVNKIKSEWPAIEGIMQESLSLVDKFNQTFNQQADKLQSDFNAVDYKKGPDFTTSPSLFDHLTESAEKLSELDKEFNTTAKTNDEERNRTLTALKEKLKSLEGILTQVREVRLDVHRNKLMPPESTNEMASFQSEVDKEIGELERDGMKPINEALEENQKLQKAFADEYTKMKTKYEQGLQNDSTGSTNDKATKNATEEFLEVKQMIESIMAELGKVVVKTGTVILGYLALLATLGILTGLITYYVIQRVRRYKELHPRRYYRVPDSRTQNVWFNK